LLIGTYTKDAIAKECMFMILILMRFNLKMFQNTINPSYLTVSNDNNFVYSVNENGKESKFSYTPSTGKLDSKF
jgi:6-phosphogluconolactonase